jgi:hypothetical protein
MLVVTKTPDQLSGYVSILALPLFNIVSINAAQVTIRNPEANFELQCATETLQYNCPSAEAKPGKHFSHKVTGFIRGRNPANDKLLELMLRYRYIIVLRNLDGTYTLIGNLTHALAMNFEFTSSPDASASLGYTITFHGDTLSTSQPITLPFIVE